MVDEDDYWPPFRDLRHALEIAAVAAAFIVFMLVAVAVVLWSFS